MRNYLPELILVGLPTFLLTALLLLLREWRERRRLALQRARDEEGGSLAEQVAKAQPPEDWAGRMDHGFALMVQRTGLPISATQGALLLLAGGLLPALAMMLWRGEWWMGGVGFLLGVLGVLAVFRLLQGRWRRKIQDEMPDALFLLARSLRAGLSLEEALATAGKHGLQPLAGEFQRCVGQIELGLTAPAALQLMAVRLQLPDFNGLVSIVTLHRTTGGNLPMLLDRWASSTRDRNQYRGFFLAATALARITAAFLILAVPVMALAYWALQPELLVRFAQTATGAVTLGVIAGLEVLGTLWILSLTRIDY
jgi:tight adherence protein B